MPFSLSRTAPADKITATEQRQAVYLNLHPGSWIYAGIKSDSILAPKQAFIGLGTTIENAIGGNGSDSIFGNDFDNNIQGGNGNDILNAGEGNDTLNGGPGNDTLTGSDAPTNSFSMLKPATPTLILSPTLPQAPTRLFWNTPFSKNYH